MLRIVEIILYTLKSGTGDRFLSVMKDVSVPLHLKWGIDVVWHGPSIHDPDNYGLIRSFADVSSLAAQQADLYGSDEWRCGPREEIVARIETTTKIVLPMMSHAIDALRTLGVVGFPLEKVSSAHEE